MGTGYVQCAAVVGRGDGELFAGDGDALGERSVGAAGLAGGWGVGGGLAARGDACGQGITAVAAAAPPPTTTRAAAIAAIHAPLCPGGRLSCRFDKAHLRAIAKLPLDGPS